MSIKKVLIIRFSSIGDIVLTSPVIRNLKTQLDDVEVHYCTRKEFHSLLISNPYIDRIHLLDDDLSSLIVQLKNEEFDYIVDLQNNLRTRIIKARLQVAGKSFNQLNLEKWLMVNLKINKLPNHHIVERYMETVTPLGIKMDSLGLDYFIPDDEHVPISQFPEAFHKEFVAFAIGAQHGTKRLPVSRMIELCDKINKPVILLGGTEDEETGNQILKFFERNEQSMPYEEGLYALGKKTIIYNACGKFSINESASLVKQAKYVFSHDNGLMHVAAAFKKEIFSIWGNTIPLFGKYPFRTRFTVFENNKINCRPCSKIGYDKCPKGHFKCMNEMIFDFYLP